MRRVCGCFSQLSASQRLPWSVCWNRRLLHRRNARSSRSCLTESGSFLCREAPDKPWHSVAAKQDISSENQVLGLGYGAALESSNRAVRMTVRGDLHGKAPFPVLETAVVFHAAADVDWDITLERGRIDLVNQSPDKRPVRIRLRVRDKSGEIVLKEPGARLAIEIYGRWLAGQRFSKTPKPEEKPALAILFLALHGDVELKGKKGELTLKAPPGPALLQADSLEDIDPQAEYLEKVPAWAVDAPADDEALEETHRRFVPLRGLIHTKGVAGAIDELLASNDEILRRAAVILMGATDDLPRLAKAMQTAKHADVWDTGVRVLRHWIGREPGQDQKLYQAMLESKVKPHEAETMVQLLHSFSKDDLAHPETYQVLINYLKNEQLGIRGLAHWHLVRLVPGGDKIAYDPLAPKDHAQRPLQSGTSSCRRGRFPEPARSRD